MAFGKPPNIDDHLVLTRLVTRESSVEMLSRICPLSNNHGNWPLERPFSATNRGFPPPRLLQGGYKQRFSRAHKQSAIILLTSRVYNLLVEPANSWDSSRSSICAWGVLLLFNCGAAWRSDQSISIDLSIRRHPLPENRWQFDGLAGGAQNSVYRPSK